MHVTVHGAAARTRATRPLRGSAALCCRLLLPAVALCASAQAAEWVPQKAIQIVVGTGPSGGADRPARIIQKIMQDQRLAPTPVTVVNKLGAGGAIANVYLNQHAGDAHYISVASPTLLTNYLTGKSALSYEDLSVIAILASEYIAFAVNANSPIKTAKDLAEALKRDPASISIGIGTTAGNNNHAAVAQFANNIGVDASKLKTVAFNSTGEVIVALLGNHLDVAALAASNLVSMSGNTQMRMIAIAAPRRPGGALAGVPTLKEMGFDVIGQQWRAIVAPTGLTGEQIAYWEKVFSAIAKNDEWKQYLDSVANDNNFLLGGNAKKFLKDQNEDMKSLLTTLRMIKPPPASDK